MRFNVELLLENEIVPKDKNRIILSILKNCFSTYSKEYYNSLYEETKNKAKDFTFSLFMNNCKFLKEEINVPDKKIYLNFSTYNYEDGIMFYNSFLTSKGKNFPVKNNSITIGKINLRREKTIFSNEVVFKTMSPIVVREHNGDNNKTWYHSLSSQKGQIVFMENLRYQLKEAFGERVEFDFKDINVDISIDNREVKIKNYGIEVLSNIAKIRIQAQPYILDYLYKAGIGSKRGSGFGMVDIL
ncbi:MAG: CRISPR-associated endoribonuclease Cas6 [Tissierellales bacterium]